MRPAFISNIINYNKPVEIYNPEYVIVSIERLRELELIESELPEIINSAIEEHKKNKLKILHERDKLNPSAVILRVKKYNTLHKDEINEKRKEKRRIKKEDTCTAFENKVTVLNSKTTDISIIERQINIALETVIYTDKISYEDIINEKNIPPPILKEVLTVRFDK